MMDPFPADRSPGAAPEPNLIVVADEGFKAHAPTGPHPERPERIDAVLRALSQARVSPQAIELRSATEEELVRVHHESYLGSLEKLRGRAGELDADTYVSEQTIDVAMRAAGSVVALVDAMLDGPVKKGLALVRPPGHHALPDRAMGFCVLNNIAVAAAHAKARGLSRVLIVDWDVHHGNGTQEIFWRDPSVLVMSLHQFPFYPGSGDVDEVGAGDGAGYTVNVPLSAHGDDAVYRAAFERVVLPVAEQFDPELVLVSAGFDASAPDPLAQMELSPHAFGWMARSLSWVAERHAGGKIAMILEGGYDLGALESGLREAIDGMVCGIATEIPRRPDARDVARASVFAKQSWQAIE